VFRGIHESKVASNILVLIKLAVLMLVIGVGAFYVNPGNWHPFAPNGFAGVLKGISGVFFAYIGFDAISTTAEECKNPQKDIPKAMILALVITTIIYILISLVLTGMVSYRELGVADPLAYVFQKLHLSWLSGVIALSAVFAMTGVLLVFQVGQPRIWMSMGRDGLLPKKFAQIHKKYKTPSFATIITGVFVGLPLFFVTFEEVIDLTSIGTLFAFILVSGGVLLIDKKDLNKENVYKIPFIGSRYFIIPIWILIIAIVYFLNNDIFKQLFDLNLPFSEFKHKIPFLVFTIAALIITILCVIKNLSLIPVISLLANAYLMTGLGITNWLRFVIWLIIGLVFYFSFGIKRSKLNIDDSI
jgi:amino acid transporter